MTSNLRDSSHDSLILCLVLAGMCIACAPLLLLAGVVGEEMAMLVYYVAAFGSSFLILNGKRRRVDGEVVHHLHPGSWKTILLLVLGAEALLFGVVGPLGWLVPVSEGFKEQVARMGSQVGVASFVVFVVAAPVLEELIFRGIVLDGLLRRHRPAPAILWASFLFGVTHLNPLQFVTAMVLGSFLGWVYWRTRRAGACMVIHMAANLGGFLVRCFTDVEAEMAADRGLLESYGGLGRFLVLEVVCVVAIVGAVLALRHTLASDGPVAPAPDRWRQETSSSAQELSGPPPSA